MVLVGDSHAEMWFDTINAIAQGYHWRLWWLTKSSCPAALLPFTGDDGGTYGACTGWHTFLVHRIKQLDPDLVIVSEENRQPPNLGKPYSNAQWTEGLEAFFRAVSSAKTRFGVIGNIPMLPQTGPNCIARHTDHIQHCTATRAASETPYHQAEAVAVEAFGGRYIDPTSWFCSTLCAPVIGNYDVYFDHFHMMGPYALHLAGVLAQALELPRSTDSARPGVLRPRNGAVLRGTATIVASEGTSTSGNIRFILIGSGQHRLDVASGESTPYGWVASWNTTGVPNGTYDLEAVARNSRGALIASSLVWFG